MKYFLFFCFFISFLFYTCNSDDNQTIYPKKFVFDHSEISNEQAFVIGDNSSYSEIYSRSGNLAALRAEVATDLFGYIRKLGVGNYVSSIVLLNQDSIRLNTWENGVNTYYDLPATMEKDTQLLDPLQFGYTIVYDKNKQELKYCTALTLEIVDRNGTFSQLIDYDFCNGILPSVQLENILSVRNIHKQDTIGIYLIDMIYR